MNRRLALAAALLLIVPGVALAAPVSHGPGGGHGGGGSSHAASVATSRVSFLGTTSLGTTTHGPGGHANAHARAGGGSAASIADYSPFTYTVDKEVAGVAASSAHPSSSYAPFAWSSAVTGAGSASGFNGISHYDQHNWGPVVNGHTTQWSLEPPDQGLCVGNGYVIEAVNTAIAAYDASSGAMVAGTNDSLNHFFGMPPEYTLNTAGSAFTSFGNFTSDPKCLYSDGHFYVTMLELSVNSANNSFLGYSHEMIAASATSNPAGTWYLYSINTTEDGNGMAAPISGPGPWFGDQPLLGADANGIYITTNVFPIVANGFNGAHIYAFSKADLANGVAHPAEQDMAVPQFSDFPSSAGWNYAYSLQPATTPEGGSYATAAGGTEYLMSALDFNGTLDDRVAVWALTNTGSLSGTPDLHLSHTIVHGAAVYGQPGDAAQKQGPMPLATSSFPASHNVLLAGNDDRMNQVVYADGELWGAVNTILAPDGGSAHVGIAWFEVAPSTSAGGAVSASMTHTGYVAAAGANVMYPSIAVDASGNALMTFTLVGSHYYPSAAYAMFDGTGFGSIHVAAAGMLPEDGFTGHGLYGPYDHTARWGDYSAAVADGNGNLWFAVEYIPGGARTYSANWGTWVGSVNVAP